MRMKLVAWVLVCLGLAAGCGAVGQTASAITGRPTEYRFDDGVRCYYSQSGSLSCLVVK